MLFFVTGGLDVFAANENYCVGARSIAVAHASVSLPDIWSVFNNQAGMAWLSKASAAIHYENKFLVKQYALQAGVLALPFTAGTGAISYRYFGYSKYNESKIGLAFARKLHKKFSAGIQMNYHSSYLAEGLGKSHALTAEIGVMYHPTENLSLGLHVFNPNHSQGNGKTDIPGPSAYRVGMCYNILNKAKFLLETEMVSEQKVIYKGGLEINATENLDVRLGIGADYMEYSFGLGYHGGYISFDLAFNHHYALGFTPSASFTFNLGKKR